jgi:hypothetical protein
MLVLGVAEGKVRTEESLLFEMVATWAAVDVLALMGEQYAESGRPGRGRLCRQQSG